jgi:hypothetical protein
LAAPTSRAVPARQVVLVRLRLPAEPVVRVEQAVQAELVVRRAEQPVQAQLLAQAELLLQAAASLPERLLWVLRAGQRRRRSFLAAMARTTR